MDIKTDKENITKVKKFLAFVLRHKPFFYKIKLDGEGFADAESLSKAIAKNLKITMTKEDIVDIAKKYSGGIFMANKDNTRIAARDGHTFIFNMNIPDGFVKADKVPKTLYAIISSKDMGNIFSSETIPLSNKKVYLTEFCPQKDDNTTVLTINTQKTIKKTEDFYYSQAEDLYFAKFITSDSVRIHV
jgi:RNA:NAD 2'-phosphotransferase (TPT1/KptA family)